MFSRTTAPRRLKPQKPSLQSSSSTWKVDLTMMFAGSIPNPEMMQDLNPADYPKQASLAAGVVVVYWLVAACMDFGAREIQRVNGRDL
ncbi:unnamed protein product [Dovyalis caffra]|uniref:Uncharacterized protein n=1 Tax=Dovyalis caffra TaxID=77055 RepID=A0AAV1RS13_9ROSI|nr:unnamed protein product [Dovyalis caffra]